jgi:hypothetical protein
MHIGGLCPGLNNVIRALTMCLWHRYGVRKILGFKYAGKRKATHEAHNRDRRPFDSAANALPPQPLDCGRLHIVVRSTRLSGF